MFEGRQVSALKLEAGMFETHSLALSIINNCSIKGEQVSEETTFMERTQGYGCTVLGGCRAAKCAIKVSCR